MVLKNWFNDIRTAFILAKNGGGGDQPKLNAPTISLLGSVITIENPSTNGNFCDGFDVYCEGEKVYHTSSTTVDITDITSHLPTGEDSFTVRCVGSKFQDSSDSNAVTAEIENVLYTKDGEKFYDADGKYFVLA